MLGFLNNSSKGVSPIYSFFKRALCVGFFVLALNSHAQFYVWNGSVNNTWNQNGNWSTAGFPNSNNALAYFSNSITSNTNISLTANVTSRWLLFFSNFNYTIGGTGSIVLDATTTGGTVFLGPLGVGSTGAHSVNVPLSLNNDNLNILNQAAGTFTVGGTLNNNGNNITILGGGSNGNINLNGAISGAGNLTVNTGYTGTVTLAGNNTYSGTTTINDGVTRITNNNALGSTTNGTTVNNGATLEIAIAGFTSLPAENLTLSGTGDSGQGALHNSTGTHILTGTTTLSGNATVQVDTGSILAFNNNINLGANTLTVNANGASGMIGSSSITGSGGFTKEGNNNWFFVGGSNTYTGTTTVNSGTVFLGVTGGTAIAGDIVVNAGTLTLNTSNQIANSSNMTLNGGTFRTNGNDETANTLTLSSSSTIDVGAGSTTLQFANSSAASWTGNLIVNNWSGSFSGGGTDQIIFGNSASGLSTAQVNQVRFFNPAGQGGWWHAQILSTGEIVPVPEPSTIITGIALGLLIIGNFLYRRFKNNKEETIED